LSVTVNIRIALDVDAVQVATGAVNDLAEGLADKVRKVLADAMRRMAADGHGGAARFGQPTVTWSGPALDAMSDATRTRAAARLTQAVVRATRASTAPAQRSKPGSAAAQNIAFGPGIQFRVTPRRFFELHAQMNGRRDDRWDRYFDLLDVPQPAVALRLTTVGMMFLDEVVALIDKTLEQRMPVVGIYHVLVWAPFGLKKVIDLEPKALAPLAGAQLSSPSYMGNLLYVHPGSRMVLAVLLLPPAATDTRTGREPVERKVLLRELDPLVDAAQFLAATKAKWTSYMAEWGGDSIAVTVSAFAVDKPTHGRALRAVYAAEANRDANDRLQLGGLILLTRQATRDLPSLKLDEFSNPLTLALPDTSVNGQWQAGWAGAYVSAWLAYDSSKIGAARYRPGGRALAARIVALLREQPYHLGFRLYGAITGEFGYGRSTRALEETTEAFGYFLEALHDTAPPGYWLAALYAAAPAHYDLYELLVRFGNASAYVNTPAVRGGTEALEKRRVAGREHFYRENAVLIDRKWWLRPGEVLADGNHLYMAAKKAQRLKKSSEAKVGGWIVDAAKAVVKRALDERRELTKDEFSQQILDDIQKRITEDDVEEIEIQRSLKLLGVREENDSGVRRHYVRFHWVERIDGEGEWSAAEVVKDEHGRPIVVEKEAGQFEELLFFWSYANSSVVVIAFTKGVTYLALFVMAWHIGAFAIVPHALGFIAINVLIYIGKAIFADGGFTIDGLAMAAVQGYAMALGFRIFAPIGRFIGTWAAERIGVESAAALIAGYLVQRALSGAITGAGSMVFTQFATDLVLVGMGAKAGFSSWREYLHAASEGAKWGILFEFGGDVFRVIGKLESFQAVGVAVRRAGLSPSKWWSELRIAEGKLRAWLFEVAGEVRALRFVELWDAFVAEMVGLRTVIVDTAKQGLLRRILTLSKVELRALSEVGLQRLLDVLEARAAEPLLRALARNPAEAARYLDALGMLDDALVATLGNRGQLAALAGSPRVVDLILRQTGAARGLVGALRLDVAAVERFLTGLERLPAPAREQGLRFFEGGGPYPPAALLLRALQYPGLVRPALAELLARLEQAGARAAVLDDLLATLERIEWGRLGTLSADQLRALSEAPQLRALLRAQGEEAAFDLVRRVGGDVAEAERIAAATSNLAGPQRVAAIEARILARQRQRLEEIRRQRQQERERAAAEARAARTLDDELAAREFRSDAVNESGTMGRRFGVDAPTIERARAEYEAAYRTEYLAARGRGIAEEEAAAAATQAARTRLTRIIQDQALVDAPRRAVTDMRTDTTGRGVPDAFRNDEVAVRDAFRDAAGGGTRGQVARDISPQLVGQSIDQMEAIAVARGGTRFPAAGTEQVVTGRVRPDGTPETYPQIEYRFTDGTRVRLKPQGDLVNSTNPMYSVELEHLVPRPGQPQQSVAFKYDVHGNPVPKGPAEIRNPYPPGPAYDAYQNAILAAGHLHAPPVAPPPPPPPTR
jgi:hypothetical protein